MSMAPLPKPSKILRSQKGVALIISLFAMMLMTFIALEVSYDTSVDYIVAAQQVNRIRAYYAAKAAVEVSLLRIQFYKQAMGNFDEALGPQKAMLDLIWSFPFAWPRTKSLSISKSFPRRSKASMGKFN